RALPLAHRNDAAADQSGGLRVGHGFLPQPHASGRSVAISPRSHRPRFLTVPPSKQAAPRARLPLPHLPAAVERGRGPRATRNAHRAACGSGKWTGVVLVVKTDERLTEESNDERLAQ